MANMLRNSIKENIMVNNKNIENTGEKNDNKQTKNDGIVASKDKFKLEKKKEDKTNKKAFNVYMEDNIVKEIDKAAKKSGHSRNELINIMCQWCLTNLDFKE
jgi:hypothetical protein